MNHLSEYLRKGGRKELRIKAAAVIHMLSLRNFKIESYTRSLNVGGLLMGGLTYVYIFFCKERKRRSRERETVRKREHDKERT